MKINKILYLILFIFLITSSNCKTTTQVVKNKEGKIYRKEFFNDKYSLYSYYKLKEWNNEGALIRIDELITSEVDTISEIIENKEKRLKIIESVTYEQILFYENRKPKEKGIIRDKKREGMWEYWDERGNKLNSKCFEKDILVDCKRGY